MSRFAPIAIGIVAAVALAGCTQLEPAPVPTPSATESLSPTGDGVLRIGTLFPMSGDVSFIGPAMVAAVEVAVRDINAAGGVLGQPVEVFFRNSGDASEQQLESAFATLVERQVDVVIGPATSPLVERLVPLAEAAGVTVITPAATAPTIDADGGQGVLFRTIPGSALHATAMVDALADEGATSVALVTTGDELGLAFERAARIALDRHEMQLASIEQMDARTSVSRLAFSTAGAEPDAVILATSASLAEQNQALLVALISRGITADQLWLTAQSAVDYSSTVEPALLEGAHGVIEGAAVSDDLVIRLRQSDPALLSFAYAPETYDAVILAALAAVLAGDDGGLSIAANLRGAAGQGVPCLSFGECLEVLTTEPAINYEGLSGPLAFDDNGDLAEGAVGRYIYTAENRLERVGTLPIIAR